MKYQIKDGEKWITVTKGAITRSGFLHYMIREKDGGIINGMARPGTFREKPLKEDK